MIKLLAMVFVAAASGAGVIAGAVALENGHASTAPSVATPQHLTMRVLTDNDRMLGPNLVVHPGRVVLTIVNSARHAHTFSVPALGVEHVVLPGSPSAPTTTTVTFTVPRGVFHWFCQLPCDKGMSGDIYAVPNAPSMRGALWAAAA